MPKAYLIATIAQVHDEAGFGEYRKAAIPTVQQYGARPIVVADTVERLEGDQAPSGSSSWSSMTWSMPSGGINRRSTAPPSRSGRSRRSPVSSWRKASRKAHAGCPGQRLHGASSLPDQGNRGEMLSSVR